MVAGNLLQDRDLVANLQNRLTITTVIMIVCTHHMFPTLHEFLIDDLACVVLSGLYMDGLFDNSICTATKGSSCAILAISSRLLYKNEID